MNKFTFVFLILTGIVSIYLISCSKQGLSPKAKYEIYCGSCHLLPNIQNIPKSIWKTNVLPEMAARMGHRYNNFNPYKGSIEENFHVKLTNAYPNTPMLDSLEWQEIQDYILSQAPNEVSNSPPRKGRNAKLTQFYSNEHTLNKKLGVTGITNLSFDALSNRLFVGNHLGQLFEWGESLPFKKRFSSPIVSCIVEDSTFYLTEIGIMNPSERSHGAIYKLQSDTITLIYNKLHRPVYTKLADLNNDGTKEMLICEFGYYTGELSLLVKNETVFEKKTLLALPGSIKVEVADMNFDGKKDIVVLFSQGREGIYILYQKEDLQFEVDPVIKLPPEYGSSWFELVDYNKDGYLDIVLVNGDNADYSIFLKPYHGIRLFLNNGENKFDERWFYPINGATRLMAEDFDLDGDIDFAVLSFFPDFINNPEEGFVYLENKHPANYQFIPATTEKVKNGNWLVMEKGDIDKDGDLDIILGNFPLLTSSKVVKENNGDVLLLENRAINQ